MPGTDFDCTHILVADLKAERAVNRPVGFCVDIGAPTSVVGKKELHRLRSKSYIRNYKRRKSHNRSRFGDVTFNSMGQVSLPLLTREGVATISVVFNIVPADVPALLGIDVLDRERLVANTVFHRLAHRTAFDLSDGRQGYVDGWSIQLLRAASRHVYVQLSRPSRVLFTRVQLSKIHRQVYHPSARKRFNVLKKARPEHATWETLEILEDISSAADLASGFAQHQFAFVCRSEPSMYPLMSAS